MYMATIHGILSAAIILIVSSGPMSCRSFLETPAVLLLME